MADLVQKTDKYIFMDVDGVLNNKEYKTTNHDINHDLDYKNVIVLQEILNDVNANLVIVSSRIGDTVKYVKLKRELAEYGIEAFDYLYKAGAYRTDYVKEYINENNIINYIVVDDTEFNHKEAFLDRYVKIDSNTGLTNGILNKVIEKYIK